MNNPYGEYDLSNYYPNLNKQNSSKSVSFVVMFFVVILLLGLAFYLTPRDKSFSYYFISVESYFNYKTASDRATEIQKQNGAGFIYYNDKYDVLTSVYLNLNDAERVLSQLQENYKDAKLIECKINHLPHNPTDEIKEIYMSSKSYIENTYQNINKLSTDSMSKNSILLSMKEDSKKFSELLNKRIKEYKRDKMYTISENLFTFQEKVNKLISDLNEESELFKYRYDLIELTIRFSSFSSLF